METFDRLRGYEAQVIRISGYIADEKVHIARQYLEPQALSDAGVPSAAAAITDAAMRELINEYARCVRASA
jgi:ATP-dependent Lon protease